MLKTIFYFILPVLILGLYYLTVHLIRIPKSMNLVLGVKLDSDEKLIAEVFGKTKQLKFKGFLVAIQDEGKLVLTNKRLLYSRYDGECFLLSILPQELLKIETPLNTMFSSVGYLPDDFLQLTFLDGVKRNKTILWKIPQYASRKIWNDKKSIEYYENPNNSAGFANVLKNWMLPTSSS